MSQITIQNELFKVGDVITPLQFQSLVLAIKEKNSFAEYCQEVTDQIDDIELTLKSQYDEIVRGLKTELNQTKETLEATKKKWEEKIALEFLVSSLKTEIETLTQVEIVKRDERILKLESELVEMESKFERLSNASENSVNLDFFENYKNRVNEVMSSINEASSSTQIINNEIQVMGETRIEVLQRIQSTPLIVDDPGVTDLRQETSEVKNFQNILAQMAEKKQKIRELPNQIGDMISELQNLWEHSESDVLIEFGKQQHQLLQTLMRWKMEIEPTVFS